MYLFLAHCKYEVNLNYGVFEEFIVLMFNYIIILVMQVLYTNLNFFEKFP